MPSEDTDATHHAPADSDTILRSFWVAGFEGADHRNGSGQPMDPATATDHLEQVERDYQLLARIGSAVFRLKASAFTRFLIVATGKRPITGITAGYGTFRPNRNRAKAHAVDF